jgi:hypothetical protein
MRENRACLPKRKRKRRRVRCQCGEVFASNKLVQCKTCRRDTDKAKYIAKLQAFAAKHGRPPTARELGGGFEPKPVPSMPSYSTLSYAFGSLKKALLAAGLTPRPRGLNVDYVPSLHTETTPRQPRRVPIAFRTDFLLALPELRREFAKALEYDGTIQVGDGAAMPRRRSA